MPLDSTDKSKPTPTLNDNGIESLGSLSIMDQSLDNDTEKPINWTRRKKWTNVMLISALTLISPFGSSMFAPSTGKAMEEFQSDNVDLESFTVSIFVLGYAFGPLIHAPLSELYGRLVVYHVNTLLFILANVACALSVNLPMLIVFRLVAGMVGSCPLAIGPASIADMFKQDERGKAIAVWNLPVLLGPALGPLVGSYLSTATGWRWDFWFLAIAMGAISIPTVILLRESHQPTLLERNARRLQKKYTTNAVSPALPPTQSRSATIWNTVIRPSKLLALSPVVLTLSLCTAANYGFIYIIFTTMTEVFMRRYDISSSNVGLTYLGFGIGNVVGNVALGVFSDRLVRRMAGNGEMKPEYRLPPMLPASVLVPLGLFLYGWTLEYNVHFMVPLFGMFLVGVGVLWVFVPINAYLVDAFTEHAASATAANTVLRSLGGGLLPLCGGKLYLAVGDGWGNSVLAFIGIGFIPVAWFVYIHGERLRLKFPVQLN